MDADFGFTSDTDLLKFALDTVDTVSLIVPIISLCHLHEWGHRQLRFAGRNCDVFIADFTEKQCRTKFRFGKDDLYLLMEVLQVPDFITLYTRHKVPGEKAFLTLLRRLTVADRVEDVAAELGVSVNARRCITVSKRYIE